jgi:hypothetical protein
VPGGLRVAVRGERFEPADEELDRILCRLAQGGIGR